MPNIKLVPYKTLIIFDEIQACPEALTSLKYFCEEAPEYHIAAAGSLLGVAVNRQQYSFPVGKVDILNLHPMDFEEFLLAMNEWELIDDIRSAFATNEPLPAVLHDTAENLYRQYLLVGGMPECVEKYVDTRDFLLIRHTQDAILTGYMSDMSKYNKTTEIHKTNLVYNSLVVQLSRKNTRFQYKLVKKAVEPPSWKMRLNGSFFLALSKEFSKSNRERSHWKITRISMTLKFICLISGY
jgi:predicted AAA+ superfamily ATPase